MNNTHQIRNSTQNESDTIEVRLELGAIGELNQNSVIEDFSATAADGKTYRAK